MPPLDPIDPNLPGGTPLTAVPASTPAPSATPDPAAVANPAAAPAPAVASTPEPAPAPTPEPKPEPKPAPAVEPTLLQKFDDEQKAKAPKAEPKPAEAPKPADAKAEPPKPGEEAKPDAAAAEAPKPIEPPAPVEYKYTLPETLQMDDAMKADVHKAFDAFRANPAEGAQALLDMHASAMQRFAEQTLAEQHRVFNEYRQNNVKAVMADPEIGGAGHMTAMGAVARMRDLVSGDMLKPRTTADGKPMISEMDEFLQSTGAGDHPVFLKMLHRFARYFDEGQEVVADGKPTKNNGARPRSGLYTDASRAKMQV